MPIVTLNASILSQNCIRACVEALPSLSAEDQHLHIIATDYVEDVDILLIAYFILFKKRYIAKYPRFTIKLDLRQNTKPAFRPDKGKPDFEAYRKIIVTKK